MISIDTYRDIGLTHPDVIVRVCSQHFIAAAGQANPAATQNIQEAIRQYGWDKAFPEQIYAPYSHDLSTMEWLVEQFETFPRPKTKSDRIFTERHLRWLLYSSSELAAQFHDRVAATAVAKYAEDYSELVDDLAFNASLIPLSLDQCRAKFESLIDDQFEDELPLSFALDQTEILARRIAALGGADLSQIDEWLDLRPDYQAIDPELEEIQVEAALHLLIQDPSLTVDITKLFNWVEADQAEVTGFALRALRSRQSIEQASRVIEEFPQYSKQLKLGLTNLLESTRFPELRDKIWKLYQDEEDFEVLGNLAKVLAAYGGDDFEKAALEVMELGGVDNAEYLRRTIYTNRVLGNRDFAEKKAWQKRLSEFLSIDYIKSEMIHQMDPDIDKEVDDDDMGDLWV